jgi:hypothetical protein
LIVTPYKAFPYYATAGRGMKQVTVRAAERETVIPFYALASLICAPGGGVFAWWLSESTFRFGIAPLTILMLVLIPALKKIWLCHTVDTDL